MDIGTYLRNKRIERGLTLKQVAEAVDVSEGNISRWECGGILNMRRDKIKPLADVLEISPLTILMSTNDEIYIPDNITGSNALEGTRRAELLNIIAELPIEKLEAIVTLIR